MIAPRTALLGVAGISLAAVGFALVSQHVYDMMPCPWCVLQRLVFVLIALVALGAAFVPAPGARRAGVVLVLLLAASGVTAVLWQHFVAAASASCNLTVADRIMSATGLDARWPELFAAYASCADAKATMLDVPYEFYSLALFVLIAATCRLAWPRRA